MGLRIYVLQDWCRPNTKLIGSPWETLATLMEKLLSTTLGRVVVCAYLEGLEGLIEHARGLSEVSSFCEHNVHSLVVKINK